MPTMDAPRILDCTLRDGSYVVDFQFTAEDTALIAAGLESAGVDLIEIGHGLGLNASAAGKGRAAATDEAYLRAAADALHRAEWGTFFIPGIGRHEDLELAAAHGMKFVRVGANAPEVAATKPYVAHARKLGLKVSVNLMKSYAVPPAQLVQLALAAESFGADTVCLVDSAGTMLPDEVRTYVARLRDALRVPIGFHGHDNLSLAMANVLAAATAGASIVDTTLQGIGRSGGNAVTEILVAILHKQGVTTGLDLNRLMDLSDRVVRPLLAGKGRSALDITAGYAGFHSSYLQLVLEYASRFRIDPRLLIVAVSDVDRVDVSEALVARVAEDLAATRGAHSGLHVVDLPMTGARTPGQGTNLADAAREVSRRVHTIAAKTSRLSVFNLVAAPHGVRSLVSRFVQEQFEYVIGSAQIGAAGDLELVAGAIDGIVDVVLADAGLSSANERSAAAVLKSILKQSRVVTYRDADVWVRAVEYQISTLLATLPTATVVLVGTDTKAIRLAGNLAERHFRIVLTGATNEALSAAAQTARQTSNRSVEVEPAIETAAARADVMTSFASAAISANVIEALPGTAMIVDAGIGALEPDAIAAAVARGLHLFRPDMRAALSAELSALLGAERIVRSLMGRSEIDGIPIVAGGVIGRPGDVVVDSIGDPRSVIGIADGAGNVSVAPDDSRVMRVERAIRRRILAADADNELAIARAAKQTDRGSS